MWRKIGTALVAVAVLATPVLAIETMTPPATVPAKIKPVAQAKAKIDPKGIAKASAAASAKAGTKIKTAKKSQPAKSVAAKSLATKSLATQSSGNQISKKSGKAGNKGKQIAAAKPSKRHAKVLPAKTKDSKAAEPVETTGSIAPRSVPMPGLY
jgi:hypothetical protein